MSKPQWIAKIVYYGDPVLAFLSIDWGDGTFAAPVDIRVPRAIALQGANAIAAYFMQECEGRKELRKDLELSDDITFS